MFSIRRELRVETKPLLSLVPSGHSFPCTQSVDYFLLATNPDENELIVPLLLWEENRNRLTFAIWNLGHNWE